MKVTYLLSAIVAFAVPLSAMAGEDENAVIEKITAAYGGDAVVNLQSYKISEKFLSPTLGQSRSPELVEITKQNQILIADLANKKVVYETWGNGRGGTFQGTTLTNGDVGHSINYQRGTFGIAQSADPYAFSGGTMRTTDTLLVHELNKVKDKVKLLGEEDYMNRPHLTLSMPFPLSPDLKLYVDAETHLISKMLRVNPQLGNLDYVFSDHKEFDGLTFATSMQFYIAGAPNLISTHRSAEFNQSYEADLFALPDGLEEEGERIDASEMVVNKIAKSVYHLGQSGGFSLFVDTTEGLVGVGGYPALNTRYERFVEESNIHKPLKYQIVTHHHSDHLGGLAEAVSMGARLVTVADNVQPIKDGVNPAPKDWNILKVGSHTTFGEGRSRVEVYEVSTIHAASFLVTYVPAAKTVFIADHMGSPFKTGVPNGGQGTVDMLAALDALDLNVTKIATAHNARIFTMKDMRAAVAAYTPIQCGADRPVCTL